MSAWLVRARFQSNFDFRGVWGGFKVCSWFVASLRLAPAQVSFDVCLLDKRSWLWRSSYNFHVKTSLPKPLPHFGGKEKTFCGGRVKGPHSMHLTCLKDVVALQILFFVAADWLLTILYATLVSFKK